ncbi:hypothetical protein E1B28_013584 [Marasmius oreades]|uniref:Uncharacterized protein n=1 Tax=Marasmius oreades TaxID=181124 RepID=A0A9P7RQY5_9AGAR|nr:uncharacterized protein E1B28_013584 [Marasmius oreades]KAG7087636.1 hypothetical protein E1B28_013584 [Marasmius oreades]
MFRKSVVLCEKPKPGRPGDQPAKIVPRPATYDNAVALVKKHYADYRLVSLSTNEHVAYAGHMVEITKDAWPAVKDDIGIIYFDGWR